MNEVVRKKEDGERKVVDCDGHHGGRELEYDREYMNVNRVAVRNEKWWTGRTYDDQSIMDPWVWCLLVCNNCSISVARPKRNGGQLMRHVAVPWRLSSVRLPITKFLDFSNGRAGKLNCLAQPNQQSSQPAMRPSPIFSPAVAV